MYTKHIDQLIEAYLDGRLSPQACQQVETHIKECSHCTHRLFDARRLNKELGPVLQTSLGQPSLPSLLRHKVRDALEKERTSRRFFFSWTMPVQIFGAVGNIVLVTLLAFGVFVVIRGQILWFNIPAGITPLGPGADDRETTRLIEATATPRLPAPVKAVTQMQLSQPRSSLGDSISFLPTPGQAKVEITQPTPLLPQVTHASQEKISPPLVAPIETGDETQPTTVAQPPLPGGTIAFALFNSTPDIQAYEIHFIHPDGSRHRLYSLRDVSEPALHPANNDYPLALRAWNEPSYPRKLLTSDLAATQLNDITHFWEDAQPDWSPTENRIIFASQRESDRRWRLYSAWGDGSLEFNLRREGRSPTFAPDGYRFAFEGCDDTGHNCGLWMGDLNNSEYGSKPFLKNSLAKSPDWSPETEEIVYMANPRENWDLYLVNSDGSNIRRLTDSPATDGLPTWSPDGEWLAFVSDRGGSWGLWLLHVDSGELHQTVSFETNSLAPANLRPYNEQGERQWWDEQLSWGP